MKNETGTKIILVSGERIKIVLVNSLGNFLGLMELSRQGKGEKNST